MPVNFDIVIERRGMYTHDPQSRLPESQSPTNPRFQKKFFLPQLADKITEATEDEVQLAHSRESRLILTSKRNDKPPWHGCLTLPAMQANYFHKIRKFFVGDFNVRYEGSQIPFIVQFSNREIALQQTMHTSYAVRFPLDPDHRGVWIFYLSVLLYDIDQRLPPTYPKILLDGWVPLDSESNILPEHKIEYSGNWVVSKFTKNVPDTMAGTTRITELQDFVLEINNSTAKKQLGAIDPVVLLPFYAFGIAHNKRTGKFIKYKQAITLNGVSCPKGNYLIFSFEKI